jgi:hypothetical protein
MDNTHDRRPLTVLIIVACLLHGVAVVLRGISNVSRPPVLELWLTGLWLFVAVAVFARRRNARALAGALLPLPFLATHLQFLFAMWLPRGMRANTTTGTVPGEQQLYAWMAYRPGDRFNDATVPDDTLCALVGLAAAALVLAWGRRVVLRLRRTHANAEDVAPDHFAQPLLLGLTGWVALMGLWGRVEDVVRTLGTDTGHEVASAANRAGALANLAPFCALLAVTLLALARPAQRALVVAAAISGVVAVAAAATALWLDGGLLWLLATARPTAADPGVVVMPAVIEGRPGWAVACALVGSVLLAAALWSRRLFAPSTPTDARADG